MKLKNIFAIALSALLFTACSEDDPIGSLSTVTLDQTYVTIPQTGGEVTVTINSTGDWAFDKINTVNKVATELPAWLTASTLSGTAGETKVKFTAAASEAGREAELRISAGGQLQFLKIRQGNMQAKTVKVSEVLAGTIGATYRVTGTISGTYSNYEQYGNYYIKDATGEVLVYGTADKDGKLKNYPVASWGLEVGDEVTVEGALGEYKGTPQLVDVTIVKLSKGLIKIVSGEGTTLDLDGGEFEVTVAYKGSGAYYKISDDAMSWLSYKGVTYKPGVKTIFEQNPSDTAVYKFVAAPNTLDKRTGSITFSSYSGKSSSLLVYAITQKGIAFPPTGSGTEADPYNVTAAIAACAAGATGVYAKGIVCKAPYFEKDNKSLTYFISADGKETSDQLEVYSGKNLQGEDFTSLDQVKVGDEVIVFGNLKMYKTTPEFDKGNKLYSINGNKGGNAQLATELDVDFTKGQGDWTIKNVSLAEGLTYVWAADSKYGMKANAFVNNKANASDSWLISPAVKLAAEGTLTFQQALNKGSKDAVKVLMSTTYAGGAINAAEWTEVSVDQWPAGTNWNFITSTAKIPAAAKVYIAFRYTSTDAAACTWEIKTLSLK